MSNGNHIENIKKVALLHDMAGYGRCSLSVIIPTLAVMGHQPVALPTALLSTHTGGYEGFTFLDLTEQLQGAVEHYRRLGVGFDGIYSGFLGSAAQIELVSGFISGFAGDSALVVVDPVMADDGVMYSTYTSEMAEGMKRLCAMADVITPNITEACFLLDEPYCEPPVTQEKCRDMVRRLRLRYGCDVVMTGAGIDGDSISTVAMRGDELLRCDQPRVPASYPGTGDIFAAVLTGALLRGMSLREGMELASGFVWRAAERTYRAGTPVREGVLFEDMLWWLSPERIT